MSKQFVLPDLGEGVKEGQVLRLLVAEGDRVDEDQLLMEVETDKAAVEIPSPYTGIIARWHVTEQQTVNVGDAMVTFDIEGENGDGPADSPATSRPTTASAPVVAAGISKPAGRTPASPAVRKLARTLGIDLSSIAGSGPGGRVLRADVQNAANGAGTATAPTHAVPGQVAPSQAGPSRAATTAPPVRHAPVPFAIVEPEGRDDTDAIGPIRREAVSRTRNAIAEMMSRAATVIPHVTDCDDADVTELDRLRRGHNEGAADDGRLNLLPFVIRAVCRALQAYPIFNASLDADCGEIVYKRYFNIAVGVQTERGLVAPVLRNVDQLTIAEIGASLRHLSRRAREGTLGLDDTRGATYTISNAGAMGGSRYSTPIITLPQVAVLAVGRSRLLPWVVGGAVTPRLIMPLSHSMDHRIIDGAIEIAFMKQLIGDLENPGRLVL